MLQLSCLDRAGCHIGPPDRFEGVRLANVQGTDGLPGSLCSITGGPVAGYNLTACSTQMNLQCSPAKLGALVGSGIGFCNFTTPGQSVSFSVCHSHELRFSAYKPPAARLV